MINTIVRGIPSTLGPVNYLGEPNICKYVVRSYKVAGSYKTSVWRLREADRDFWWTDGKPEYAHLVKDDRKEDMMFDEEHHQWAGSYLWDCSAKEIGSHHQDVCMEIVNGEFWDGEWALP